jgi:NADH:ubiquinone oxidoreductase subunit E
VKRQIVICMQQRYAPNPVCCFNHGSMELLELLQAELSDANAHVDVVTSGCMGMCHHGPNMKLLPDGEVWNRAGHEQVLEVINRLNDIKV